MSEQPKYMDNQDNPVFKELISILGNGFILSLFTINFLCFEYVLPILGSIIMLYGCHLVKTENKYFTRTYYIATARLVAMLGNFLIDWTVFHNNLIVTYIQITVSAALIVLLFYHLNLAFKTLYVSAGIQPYNNRLAQYIVLYLCSIAATYLTVHLGVIGAMISLFILILNIIFLLLAFSQIGKVLSTTNLTLHLTPYTSKDHTKAIVYLTSYIVLVIFTIMFCNKISFLPFSTSSNLSSEHSSLSNTENKLLDYGMTTEVLKDLPQSEIEYLIKATGITAKQSIQTVNNDSLEITAYEVYCVDYTRVIIHYKWLTPPSNRLYQIIECQFDNSIAENISSSSLVTDQKTNDTLTTPNISIGLNASNYPYVQQKLSNDGTDLRGYLAFSYRSKPGTSATKLTVNCYYQISVFNLPYLNIMDYMNHYKYHTNSFVFDRIQAVYKLK